MKRNNFKKGRRNAPKTDVDKICSVSVIISLLTIALNLLLNLDKMISILQYLLSCLSL